MFSESYEETMEAEIKTEATRSSTTDEAREAWHRPVVSRLPLSETLLGGGSGVDGGVFASPP